ncbi:hypothetical protein Z947_758 [Sulfitobacter geojensis]|nr:hypothetical protein Z947_758 [Sulfitobacter geojensis]
MFHRTLDVSGTAHGSQIFDLRLRGDPCFWWRTVLMLKGTGS